MCGNRLLLNISVLRNSMYRPFSYVHILNDTFVFQVSLKTSTVYVYLCEISLLTPWKYMSERLGVQLHLFLTSTLDKNAKALGPGRFTSR